MLQLSLNAFCDFHAHLRDGTVLTQAIGHHQRSCQCVLVMPNLTPPIVTPGDVEAYRARLLAAQAGTHRFEPLMTVKLGNGLNASCLESAKKLGVKAVKYYPEGVTTNAHGGPKDLFEMMELLYLIQEHDLVLCLHGEMPGVNVLQAEEAFFGTLKRLVQQFPRLRIVLEHISTAAAVTLIKELPDTVAATITAHHLRHTFEDLMGAKLRPHLFCKPVLKFSEDRAALLEAATSGNPKFFFGSDSAPHDRKHKEAACCNAGVYASPVMAPLLAEIFEQAGRLHRLEDFTSTFGATFYRQPLTGRQITLAREPWTVPTKDGPLVPYLAGETLTWKLLA